MLTRVSRVHTMRAASDDVILHRDRMYSNRGATACDCTPENFVQVLIVRVVHDAHKARTTRCALCKIMFRGGLIPEDIELVKLLFPRSRSTSYINILPN